jgi:hypothetical protein
MLAFVHVLEFTATDDAIDLLDWLIGDLLATSKRDGEKERLRTIKDLDAAALRLCFACGVLLDPTCDDVDVRSQVFARINKEQLAQAMAKVEALARPPEDNYYDLMLSRWRHVRKFLPKLLLTIDFEGTESAVPISDALQFLRSIEGQKKPDMSTAPLAVVSKNWARLVVGAQGEIDRKAYTFCVLERLRIALRRRDVFVSKSLRWGDPRAKLLQGEAWESSRSAVCRTLNLEPTPLAEIEALRCQLDEAYRRRILIQLNRGEGRHSLARTVFHVRLQKLILVNFP